MTFRFEGLQIWHGARKFSDRVYKVVARFPEVEKFGLTSQMIRAANSVSLNIAEGAGRDTDTEFNRFLGIAVGSLFEVASGSFIALDQGYITPEQHRALYAEAQKLAKSINSFRRTLNKKSKR
jgi:four helix bundle protein